MTKAAETELCFYARIGERSGLEKATKQEIHAQYSYNVMSDQEAGVRKGRVRVRATTVDGQTTYEETLKVPTDSGFVVQGNTEYNIPITKDYYEAWLATYGAKGVNKIRYVFLSKNVELETEGQTVVLPEVKYEVDVFLNQEGKPSNWCKIDIEIDGIVAYLAEHHPEIKKFDTTVKLSALPFKPEDAFEATTEDEVKKAAIKAFWDAFSYFPKKDTQV